MKILIAEDDNVVRTQLKASLAKWEYDVVEASDGAEAWERIESEDSPSILILDWEMPGMNGLEICRRTRALNREPSPYIILLTAKSEKESIVEGMEAGADDYMVKPFYPHELKVRLTAGIRIVKLQQKYIEARGKLEIQATHDSLTGVFNRGAIIKSLEVEIERAGREVTDLSVALLDADNFKKINDTFGHHAGDKVLRDLVEKIGAGLRPYDNFGRYGGEEFLMVLPGCGLENAVDVTERIREAIANSSVEVDGKSLTFTVSIGVSSLPAGFRGDMEALLKTADHALYEAKGNGRNCVVAATGD